MASPKPIPRDRMLSVDAVRGLVLVIMAIDHVRDFFHANSLLYSPNDLSQASPAEFLTRFITHMCAPSFVFLAGVSAFLWAQRGKSQRELSRFLLSRGLWLVVAELTIVRCLGWYFNFNYHDTMGQVIWAIGWSMVALSALVYLPRWEIGMVALVLIVGHNGLDWIDSKELGRLDWLWSILHSGSGIELSSKIYFRPDYPLVPWIGVLAAGYACGPWCSAPNPIRRRFFLGMGIVLTLAFVIVRGFNDYGDPYEWSTEERPMYTLFSFLNCTKYPPSLDYLLMTLGPMFLILAFFEYHERFAVGPLVTFGRVSFFFYLLHLFLIHSLAVVLSLWEYDGRASWLFTRPPFMGRGLYPKGYGYSLLHVYAITAIVILILWPACRWYARFKRNHRDWAWLSYL